ncbi:hypothetical protein [Halobaculum rarum]|uniref:hypothetical protein n=1 Tax=Halobaculum rarum TaxID=3075122 RepID=UPI0032AE9408
MVQAARSVDEKEIERRLLNDVDDNFKRSLALRGDLDKLAQGDSTITSPRCPTNSATRSSSRSNA